MRLPQEEVAAALDVLLGNVFAHTPDGTPHSVSVRAMGHRVELAVEDGGDGIADPEAYLDRGSSAAGLTGLSLGIASSAAPAAGGELRVERSVGLGGAGVVLDLPRAEDGRTLSP